MRKEVQRTKITVTALTVTNNIDDKNRSCGFQKELNMFQLNSISTMLIL